MLKQLTIKNLAIIDDITIDFDYGFNVMTGETGAGKSIIIDAINLVFGARASSDLIAYGKDSAYISAALYLNKEIAKNLWTAAIRTKDHGLIKDFADLYTKINHKGLDFNSNVDVNSAKSIQKKLDDDFENWLDKWVYSNSKKHLPLKILFYRLLLLKRKRIDEEIYLCQEKMLDIL